MDLLSLRTTDEEQANALKMFIPKKKANIKMGNNLLKTYFENKLDAFQPMFESALQQTGEKNYLVKERNNKWMQVLPALLKRRS